MSKPSFIVVVSGGCVTDVIGTSDYDVFDWDNFETDPVATWEDGGWLASESEAFMREQRPEMWKEAIKRYEAAKEAQAHWDEQERIKAESVISMN